MPFFICLLSFLWISVSTVYAQPQFGVKAGVNFSWLAPRPAGERTTTEAGLTIGVYGRFRIPLIGIYAQPELNFSQKGANVSRDIPGGTQRETVRIQAIDFPVLIGKEFLGGLLRVYVGPNFSFAVASTFRQETNLSGSSPIVLNINRDNINNFLFGYQIGIGSDILNKIVIDLRYEGFLTQLYKSTGNYRPNLIQFTVGYRIK